MRIIRFKHPNLRFIEGEGGDVGGGAPVGDSTDAGAAPQSDSSQGGGGINPAWNDVLNLIPAQLHEGVIPHLKKWDDNYKQEQTKLSEVQSRAERWSQFADADPEVMSQAMQFWQIAEQDPMRVYTELAKFLGVEGDQGQQGQEGNDGQEPDPSLFGLDEDAILQHPKVQELLRGQEVLAQTFLQQQQAEQVRELNNQIEAEQATIMEANPDFTEKELVLMYQIAGASNISLTEAAEQVKGYFGDVAQRTAAPHAPSIMGANGMVPSAQPVDPTKLNGQQTKSLVADLIRQANQGQG